MESTTRFSEEPKFDEKEDDKDLNSPRARLHFGKSRSSFFDQISAVAVDIGGSFSKIVYWRPQNPPDLPDYIIKEFHDDGAKVKFPLRPDPTLRVALKMDKEQEGDLRFLKFPSHKTLEFCQFVSEHELHQSYGKGRTNTVNATGGGAYKYAEVVKEKLGITFEKYDEMKCLIDGLNFLLQNVDGEAFTYDWKKKEQTFLTFAKCKEEDPKFPFPYLLVNIGSGVSVLKVGETSFERVSGTSLGGGTFWGLCKLLTDIQSFDEVKALSEKGDNRTVDLLAGDIYGSDLGALGLGADVIASSLGKVATKRSEDQLPPKKEDIVRSLLFMISNNIAQIGYLNAKLHNIQRIIFSVDFFKRILTFGADFPTLLTFGLMEK